MMQVQKQLCNPFEARIIALLAAEGHFPRPGETVAHLMARAFNLDVTDVVHKLASMATDQNAVANSTITSYHTRGFKHE